MKKLFMIILVLIVAMPLFSKQKLTVTFDDYPPFSYKENNTAKGIGAEVIKAVLKDAGVDAVFEEFPFARAYEMAQSKSEEVFYFCLAKTEERESLFQWIGVVAPSEQSIFCLTDMYFQIQDLDKLRNESIGTVNQDIVDQYLKKLKFKTDGAANYELALKKLAGNRYDYVGMSKYVALNLAQELGIDIKEVYNIKELTGEYYLVASPAVPKDIVEKLKSSFDKIHKNGTYDKIIKNYFK